MKIGDLVGKTSFESLSISSVAGYSSLKLAVELL